MTTETRTIGLSLGADLCWPAAYEELLKRMDPKIQYKGKEINFVCERVRVEPFDLEYKPKYDLVLDRVTHWYNISQELKSQPKKELMMRVVMVARCHSSALR